jgi:regulator of sirC expression with transglutaminase-like and TPR domain
MSIVVENTGFRPTPAMFQPATRRQIAVRMLQNLKSIYLKTGAWEKAVATLDLILEADPAAAQEYKQRGWANLQLQRFQPAQTDLQDYLKLNPEAEDAELIKEHLESVYRYLSGLH